MATGREQLWREFQEEAEKVRAEHLLQWALLGLLGSVKRLPPMMGNGEEGQGCSVSQEQEQQHLLVQQKEQEEQQLLVQQKEQEQEQHLS